MEISNFTKYFVYWKISLVMLLENIITSDVIGKYIMGRLTNIGKYSSWSLILEASLHKIYWENKQWLVFDIGKYHEWLW